MIPLETSVRRRLLQISAVVCAISLLLLPLAAQSSRSLPSEHANITRVLRAAAVVTPLLEIPPIAVSRDPFVPPATASQAPETQARVVLRAIALGAQPAALIEENAKTRLVVPGDAVAGSRVARITSNGISLADGRQLMLQVQQQ